MQYIDPYAAFAAVIYFFGVFLYYVHVKTILYLLEKEHEMNRRKILSDSIFWIFNVLVLMWIEFTGEDDDR
jgi:uncharacterized membrane protein HdeD (DUF308 family)|tara:strand:+ start:31 stop:243 length:213 start_codon:yes stop_codon:yes gene_type:complete